MNRRDFVKYGIVLAGAGGLGLSVLKLFDKPSPDNFQHNFLALDKPCSFPFEFMEIHEEGKIYPCCPNFVDFKPMGNFYDQDLFSIWNGKKFKELRNKLLKGDFSSCNRNICCYNPAEYTKDFNAAKQLPINIHLCYDQECNYKCITCRDEIFTNSDEELAKLNNEILPKILPFISKLDEIEFSGGDPLASRHSRKLIYEVNKSNPNINISINTQGYFLDENNMKELGITKLYSVGMSIHSATRKTYEKIMRQDSFDRIMKNLEFISGWKKQGKLENLRIHFVVHLMNYKEMPAFVKIAEKFDAIAYFWSYKPWESAEMHKRYKEVAVFEPWHKDYPKLKKMLKNPIFKSKHCILYPELLKIAEE
ncbi:MAG: SPASM domain-containing protein [Candidatus Gastranaerophilales bacterium]|nr:SPASM domain-containing protein [Candidatus Gastranaerophilales bacterium]